MNRKVELGLRTSKSELNAMGIEGISFKLGERVREIMEYTGESAEVVAGKINGSVDDGSELWKEMKPVNEKGLAVFHSKTRRKIYSMSGICDYLAVIREKILSRIIEKGEGASLLDFGGSHGHFSIGAAEAGLEVTYADIGEEIRKFAQWKFDRRGLNIRIAPIKEDKCVFSDRKYDFIVCLDVASHLPDLERYIKEFHSCLNKELFFGDDLFDFLVPWHLEENKIYKDLKMKKRLFERFRFAGHIWANCDAWKKDEV